METTQKELICTVKPQLGDLSLAYGPLVSLTVFVPNEGNLKFKSVSDVYVAGIKNAIRFRFRIPNDTKIILKWESN